jgi:hypothetical protein
VAIAPIVARPQDAGLLTRRTPGVGR